jgi:gas vesicle protein
MNNASKIMLAALTGAAVGALATLLFAPASGEETREKLKEQLAAAKDSIDDLLSQGKEIAGNTVKKVKDEATKDRNEMTRATNSHS